METKRALITGITGQDGSYLAELLLSKGYEVYGLVRRSSTLSNERIIHIQNQIRLIEGDLGDTSSMIRVLRAAKPHEVYNLAAMSFVKTSFDEPVATGNITGLGVARLLEAVRLVDPTIHFYQASSSEMFGKVRESPQTELTPFHPRSPYGVAKAYGHYISLNYRESYGIFTANGILFNHESPRRGLEFVTRKISHGVAKIKLGFADHIILGNLDAKRDWGFAGDYVDAMWRMLQAQEPSDYVVGTGETHSIREFLEAAFRSAGIDDWQHYVKQDPRFMRPAEVDLLLANPAKAKKELGWEPKTSFGQLVNIMIEYDIDLLTRLPHLGKAAHHH
ncbi:GDP-mannose 4,6-dehydratase [Candidatus Woesearchaeota archaeon]|nr:GDP-mannose 4,6-dehydratase [Candidatus Woesearchaeota archaeon]